MVAKVLSLDAARRRPCRRADGSLPGRGRRPDARLDRALAAVAALGTAAFERKLEVFKRVWEEGRRREDADGPRR